MAALAAVPLVSENVSVRWGNPHQYLMLQKRGGLQPQACGPVMAAGNYGFSPQQFFTDYGINPGHNRLMKKAPRRISVDDIMASKLAFMTSYSMNEDFTEVAPSSIFYYGGWDAEMEQVDDNWFNAYVYYSSLPFSIYVDYDTQTAWMETGCLGGWNWSDTIVSGRTTTINDTTEYIFLVDENYLFDEYAEDFTNLEGEVYSDGSIYFPDGWCCYTIDYVQTKVTRSLTATTVTYDTIWNCSDLYRDTYLLTANAIQDYDYEGQSSNADHYQNLAYMFQYDDTTAVVWNIYGYGNQGNYMFIHEDGSLVFPTGQYGGDMASMREWLEANYSSYNWEDADHVVLMAYDEETGYAAQGVDMTGTVTPGQLSWSPTVFTWWGWFYYDDGTVSYSPGIGNEPTGTKASMRQIYWNYAMLGPCTNNTLTFINGEKWIFGYAETPEIVVGEGDDAYTFAGVSSDGADIYLFACDPATGETISMLDNPYIVVRTTEDQTIHLAAMADGYNIGKNNSEWVYGTYVVPALSVPDPDSDNFFIIGDAEVLHGDAVVIPVSLTNANEVTAFQTDLYLPEGFELVGDVEGSDRLTDHELQMNLMPDGAVRILCYSNTLAPIVGNEGELFYLTIQTPDAVWGDFELELRKNLLTSTDFVEMNCANATGVLTVLPYLKGDANGDRRVTITDVVVTVQYLLGQNPDTFVFGAADMNDNGEITVTDIVLIINMILNATAPDQAQQPRACAPAHNNDVMTARPVSVAVGETRTVTIALDNEMDYTAFQLDVCLPEGLTGSNYRLTDRAGSHALSVNGDNADCQRVVCYSPQLDCFAGNKGALLTFDVTAASAVNGEIIVAGIEMVTAAGQTVYLDDFTVEVNNGGVTAVNEIGGDLRIYTDGHHIIVESPVEQHVVISDAMGHAYSVKIEAGRNVIPARTTGLVIVACDGKSAKLMLR